MCHVIMFKDGKSNENNKEIGTQSLCPYDKNCIHCYLLYHFNS